MVTSLTRPVGRKAWIDVTKGAAIFLVVLYHASLYLAETGMSGIPWLVKIPLELFPMPALFVLAGLVSARSSGFTFAELWRRRVLPMLYLYVVWSVIRFLFFVAIPPLGGGRGDLPASSPLTLALIFVWPSSSYWFLYALAIFTVAGWLIRRVPVAVQLALAGALSVIVTSGIVDTGNVGWNRVSGLFVFYLAGLTLAKGMEGALERSRGWMIGAIGAAAVAWVGLMIVFRIGGIPGGVLIGQVLVVATGFGIARLIAPLRPVAFLSDWGASSLHIYLLHLYVIVPVAAVIAASGWIPPRWLGLVCQLVLALAAIAVSLLLMRWTGRARWLWLPPRSWLRGRDRRIPVSSSVPTRRRT